jgi:tetratricopeptide (TPR) repeat protein
MVIALPFSLYLSWHRGENLRTIIRRLAPLGLLLALAFLTQLALASRETSTWNSLEHYPDADFLALVLGWLRVLLWLLSRLLTTAHWLPLPVALQTWELYLGALVLIGLAYGAWRKDIWAVWTLLALMPFLFLTEATLIDMPVGPSRYLYPASAGASLLLARGLYQIGQRPLQIGLLAALLFSSYATLDKTEALSRYTSGRSYIASSQTAHGMQRHGDMPKGIDQLRRAIDLGGDAIDLQDAHTRLILIALDSAQVATPILRAARTHFPDDAKFALAEQVFHSLHADPIQQRHALTALETAGDQSADNAHWIATLYANMGDGYYARRDWPLAIRAYEHALRFDPGRKNTRLLVGWTYFITNRFEDAIAAYRAVLTRGPDSEAQFNMGLAYMALGDLEIAQKTYAEGFARYGRREADQAKVRENLERLTAQGIQPEATRQLLQRYFPD